MNVNVQSIKFDADKKLIEFIEKKVEKLNKFFDGIVNLEVFLRLENVPLENKHVVIKVEIPGTDLLAERTCKTFEEATDECVDALKIQLNKAKEKMRK